MSRRQALTCLAQWITFLFHAVPARIRPTLLELLLGCMAAAGTGHVTEAILAITTAKHWTTYYNAIEHGVFSWLALTKQWTLLLCQVIKPKEITIVIDDTIIFRSSKKAPSTALHHDHANRPNRPKYVWGQILVGLAMICEVENRKGVFPIFMRMVRSCGNRSKLNAAGVLVRVFVRWLGNHVPILVLMDAWYMKGPLVLEALKLELNVIGQVRKDTALFLLPQANATPKRGRPRKYGLKLDFQQVCNLFKIQEEKLLAYGKEHIFQYYCFDARVRFLKGRECRMVWVRMREDKTDAQWTGWRLLLSTNVNLCGMQIIQKYGLRWFVESCFNVLKNTFGLKDTWQQTRQTVARWRTMVCLAYGLAQLLTVIFGENLGKALQPIPWRKDRTMTAGWMLKGLAGIFRNYRVRIFWDRKCQKCIFPEEFLEPKLGKAV